MRGLQRDERGSMAASTAIVMPVVLLLLTLGLQAFFNYHAQNTAQIAAEEGLASARALDGSTSVAKARAQSYADRISGRFTTSSSVAVNRGAEQASVTVTMRVKRIAPFVPTTVTTTRSASVERYVEEAP